MNDHEIAKVVNELRDVAIEFHGAEQLRARIASLIVPLLKERAQPAGEAVQIGPAKAYCQTCKDVTPCEWRWNSDTCADLCCKVCHDIHVCVHEFSDCDSQRLGALARAVMHDHVYHDTLQARVEELEAQVAAPPAAANQAGVPDGWKLVPKERSYDMRARAIIAYNTAVHDGADRDDALKAAWEAELSAAPTESQARGGDGECPTRADALKFVMRWVPEPNHGRAADDLLAFLAGRASVKMV